MYIKLFFILNLLYLKKTVYLQSSNELFLNIKKPGGLVALFLILYVFLYEKISNYIPI